MPPTDARAVEHRIGAVVDLDLLQVERVGAAVLGAVADAVLGDVVARRIAAQVDRIAIAAAALAGAEGDSGNGGRARRAGSADSGGAASGREMTVTVCGVSSSGAVALGDSSSALLALAGDDDVASLALLDVALARRRRAGIRGERGRGEEADAAQREEQAARAAAAAETCRSCNEPLRRAGRSRSLKRLLQFIRNSVKRVANGSQLTGIPLPKGPSGAGVTAAVTPAPFFRWTTAVRQGQSPFQRVRNSRSAAWKAAGWSNMMKW